MSRLYIPAKQEGRILDYLREHDGMTTFDAMMDLRISAPAKCIEKLRNGGYDIETVWRKTNSGERYGVYVLHEEQEEMLCLAK